MPDGNAQRPGDIVKSMSGQTIAVLNTDAEGRLVLADVLWYVQDRFKPKFMIDLATLTGAIIVALGQEYAGMFSNDDRLCDRLTKAGQATMERVWRMPLGPEYDKQIDSKFADMKNTGGRWGGAITAAQLLARFVGKTPWAHLDIAGVAGARKTSMLQDLELGRAMEIDALLGAVVELGGGVCRGGTTEVVDGTRGWRAGAGGDVGRGHAGRERDRDALLPSGLHGDVGPELELHASRHGRSGCVPSPHRPTAQQPGLRRQRPGRLRGSARLTTRKPDHPSTTG